MKILLVENSRTARLLLSRQLRDAGYDIDAVASGLEAIEAVQNAEYHLIIMDVFLPQMNGYEAAEKIRAIHNNPDLVILGFTSSTSEKDKKRCLESGMNSYILKTEDNHELMLALEDFKKNNGNQRASY